MVKTRNTQVYIPQFETVGSSLLYPSIVLFWKRVHFKLKVVIFAGTFLANQQCPPDLNLWIKNLISWIWPIRDIKYRAKYLYSMLFLSISGIKTNWKCKYAIILVHFREPSLFACPHQSYLIFMRVIHKHTVNHRIGYQSIATQHWYVRSYDGVHFWYKAVHETTHTAALMMKINKDR